MKRLFPRIILAVAACLVLAGPSWAGLVDWSYSTSPTTTTVTADGVSPVGYVKLSGDSSISASGGSDIVLANLSAFSTVNPLSPESFTSRTWQVGLTITDTVSHTSGTLYFTGRFDGSLSSMSSNLNNVFTGLVSQSITLGGNTYTVTANSYVPPSVPNALNAGGFGAHIDVTSGVTVITHGLPEPSSLLLCGLGAAGCAVAGRRRRK